MKREHRVAGTIIGAVVGDVLGAPFEFGSPGAFSRRFPVPARGVATEMCGGGSCGWKPGEFTDDTQMALIAAESLVRCGELDEADMFDGFKSWIGATHLTSVSRPLPFCAQLTHGRRPPPSTSRAANARLVTGRSCEPHLERCSSRNREHARPWTLLAHVRSHPR